MDKNIKDLRIIFMGTPRLAEEVLSFLVKSELNIVAAVTQPDRPAGRKKEVLISPVKKLAQKRSIEVAQFEKIDKKALGFFKSKKPDLIVLVAFGMILPKELLDIPHLGSINVHPSLLPKFRGPSPIQSAIASGGQETGVSVMLMNDKMDEGPILSQKKMNIGSTDKYLEVENKVIEVSKKLLLETLKRWVKKEISPKPQNENEATFCKLVSKKDGLINWSESSTEIFNKHRALNQWPRTFSFWKDEEKKQKIILDKIREKQGTFKNRKSGSVFEKESEVLVATGSGAIILESVQPEGKKEMSIKDFVNGRPHFIGSKLES